MDAKLKNEITQTVKAAMMEANEVYQEQWLNGENLTRQIQCFTKSWIKTYGHLLPRTRASVFDPLTGKETHTGWIYPLHRIQRMIAENRIQGLTARQASRLSA